jgi:thiol-disulfide isomerase/thioredoxin
MIERIIFVAFLMVFGVVAYRLYTRYHLKWAAASASVDPLLHDLKPDVATIVYFTTPTCVPCRTQQQPALVRLQAELGESIQIIQIDATQNAEAADRWGVFSAPTTFVLDSRRQVLDVNYGVADTNKLKRQLAAAGVN